MALPFTGLLLVPCAGMLGYFAYRRFVAYRRDRANTVNYRYYLAALFVSGGFVFYGAPSVLFGEHNDALVVGTIIATILNAIGFSHFFAIPLYNWLSHKAFVVGVHLLYLYDASVAGLLVLSPPRTFLDGYGIIHWRFTAAQSAAMLALIGIAFILNVALLWQHLQKLRAFSFLNAVALILTFLVTGLSGGYLYVGDNTLLLALAAVFLYIGISIIFFASVRTALTHAA